MKTARISLAAAGHFGVLFAVYLVSGPLRATYLDAALGPHTGAVTEAAMFLIASIVAVSKVMPRLSPLWLVPEALVVGLGALALFIICDLAIAESLCGIPAMRHFARFSTVPGAIQAAALTFHAFAPVAWWCGGSETEAPELIIQASGGEVSSQLSS